MIAVTFQRCAKPTMDTNASFDAVFEGLRLGEEKAAVEIFARFSQRLIALASRRISGSLRQKVDPEDLVQSAFKSFFRAHEGAAVQVQDWHSLWSLLATITLRKAGHQLRRFQTEKRDVRKEVSGIANDHESRPGIEALAREPTPAEATILQETVEFLLNGTKDKARDVIELSLQGWGPEEISAKVGLSERTVFRQLARLKAQLLALAQGP